MVSMTQSKQSIEVAVKAGWINYQSMYMGIDPEKGARVDIPLQFRHIFMIGYAMGDCSGNILPLLKAQSAAYDALVAAVDAEETT